MMNNNAGMVHRGKILLCTASEAPYFYIAHIRECKILVCILQWALFSSYVMDEEMINVYKQTADLITHINVDI